MKASMPRPWPARRFVAERFCCDSLCTNSTCPLLTDPAYRESAADFADERFAIPQGVPTGEHRPASLLMRVLRWFK